ncbi:MAG: PqqD family protein, partial [Marinomonas sp.]
DTITASDDVVSREVNGEAVLLDLASGLYFGLNVVGSAIWQVVGDAPAKVSALCDAVEAEFDAPRDVIEADVEELLGELVAAGLVTRGPA